MQNIYGATSYELIDWFSAKNGSILTAFADFSLLVKGQESDILNPTIPTLSIGNYTDNTHQYMINGTSTCINNPCFDANYSGPLGNYTSIVANKLYDRSTGLLLESNYHALINNYYDYSYSTQVIDLGPAFSTGTI